MRRAGAVMAGMATLLLASFLLASAHPFGNAHLGDPGGLLLEHATVPPEVRETLMNKCADCHSMQTRAPIYARFAPVSWLVERDVVQGRKEMNLSQWTHYSPEQQEVFKAKIVQQTKARSMPLLQYRLIHWGAWITDRDVVAFTRWERADAANGTGQTTTSAEGDFLRGKAVFERRCTGCHSIEQNHEGPKLRGVFGRTSGTAPGFSYSTALKQAHIVWDEAWLEKWLTDTDDAVPGNNMDFHVPRAQERKDVVAYLKTLR